MAQFLVNWKTIQLTENNSYKVFHEQKMTIISEIRKNIINIMTSKGFVTISAQGFRLSATENFKTRKKQDLKIINLNQNQIGKT